MVKVKITNSHPSDVVAIYPGTEVLALDPYQSVEVDQSDISAQIKGLEERGRVTLEVVSEEKGPSSPRRLRASKLKLSESQEEDSSLGTTNAGNE